MISPHPSNSRATLEKALIGNSHHLSNPNSLLALLQAQQQQQQQQQQSPLNSMHSMHSIPKNFNPRLSQALLELQAAESLFAKSQRPQPTPWLMNNILTQQLQRPSSPEAAILLKLQDVQGNSHLVTASPPFTKPIAIACPTAVPSLVSKNKTALTYNEVDKSSSPIQTIRLAVSSGSRQYVSKISEADILCGRGGKSNHHQGNKKYRQVISQMKRSYKSIGSKSAKTDLSRAIVEHVYQYGGRFVKQDNASGKFVVLTASDARKKTSQALREAKDVKWTM